ncbi:unnamed protein product [Trichobilharzia regenti]|nr:unnamed protein product [Trichobilharzia regenti]
MCSIYRSGNLNSITEHCELSDGDYCRALLILNDGEGIPTDYCLPSTFKRNNLEEHQHIEFTSTSNVFVTSAVEFQSLHTPQFKQTGDSNTQRTSKSSTSSSLSMCI